jgi:hypothetical protein
MKSWDILRQECPKLYKNGIAFECNIGWYDILHDLSIKIEKILEEYAENHKTDGGKEDEIIEMFAVQVKEKYGILRFYMSCETNEINYLIHESEALSSQVCENCGAPAKMRGTRWFEVKCDACFSGGK